MSVAKSMPLAVIALVLMSCSSPPEPRPDDQSWAPEDFELDRRVAGPHVQPEFVAIPRFADLYAHPVTAPWTLGEDGFWVMEVLYENDGWMMVRYDNEFATCDDAFPGLDDGLYAAFWVREEVVKRSEQPGECAASAALPEWPDADAEAPEEKSETGRWIDAPSMFSLRGLGEVRGSMGMLRKRHRFGAERPPSAEGWRCFVLTENGDGDPLEACFHRTVLKEKSYPPDDDNDAKMEEKAANYAAENGAWGDRIRDDLSTSDDLLACVPESMDDVFRHSTNLAVVVDGDGAAVDTHQMPGSPYAEFAECAADVLGKKSFPAHPRLERAAFRLQTLCDDSPCDKDSVTVGIWPATDATYGTLPRPYIGDVTRRHRPAFRACSERHVPSDFSDIDHQRLQVVVAPDGSVASASVRNPHPKLGDYYACVTNEARQMTFGPPAGGGVVRINKIVEITPR